MTINDQLWDHMVAPLQQREHAVAQQLSSLSPQSKPAQLEERALLLAALDLHQHLRLHYVQKHSALLGSVLLYQHVARAAAGGRGGVQREAQVLLRVLPKPVALEEARRCYG